MIQGRNRLQKVPKVLICLIIQHPSATDHVSFLLITSSIITAAQHFHFFNNVNVLSRKIAISDEIDSSGQGSDSPANKIHLLLTVLLLHHYRLQKIHNLSFNVK
ncbi:hypothetical protein D3C78_1534740 [compost metagenome]